MQKKSLFIATTNAGKHREIRACLPAAWRLVTPDEKPVPVVDETGHSFHDNAQLKAVSAMRHSGWPALADDSGLCIEALNGWPGINSAPVAETHGGYDGVFRHLETVLAPHPRAAAHFMCVLCLALPNGALHFFEGRVDGHLEFPPRGSGGFGYDPIFVPSGHDKTFGEMGSEIKNTLSARGRALAQLRIFLNGKDVL